MRRPPHRHQRREADDVGSRQAEAGHRGDRGRSLQFAHRGNLGGELLVLAQFRISDGAGIMTHRLDIGEVGRLLGARQYLGRGGILGEREGGRGVARVAAEKVTGRSAALEMVTAIAAVVASVKSLNIGEAPRAHRGCAREAIPGPGRCPCGGG